MNMIFHCFLYIFNMSVAAYTGIVVILARFAFLAFFKQSTPLLWIAPAFRLVCPVSLAGSLSLLSWFPISMQDYYPIGTESPIVLSQLRTVSAAAAEHGVLGRPIACIWVGGMVLLTLFHVRRMLGGNVKRNDEPSAHTQRERRIKGLAQCFLMIHWFNPVMWLCFYFMCRDTKTSGVEQSKSPWKNKAFWIASAMLAVLCLLNPYNNQDHLQREDITAIESETGSPGWKEIAGNAACEDYLIHVINTANRTSVTETTKSFSWYGDPEPLLRITSAQSESGKQVEYRFVRIHAQSYSIFYGEIEDGLALYRKEAGSAEKCYMLPYELVATLSAKRTY